MSFFQTLRRRLMEMKFIATRLGGYLSLINLGMVMFLTISDLNEKGYINIDVGKYLIPIYISLIILVFIFGYVETYILKGFREETEATFRHMGIHPELRDMKRKVDEMYNKSIMDKKEEIKNE